jgi:hypothetical protein
MGWISNKEGDVWVKIYRRITFIQNPFVENDTSLEGEEEGQYLIEVKGFSILDKKLKKQIIEELKKEL